MDKTFEQLKNKILSYNPNANIKLVEKAYNFTKDAHKGQKRRSGDPFFTHPVEVAKILISLRTASSTIAAGLLHDVLEDTNITIDELTKMFGKEVVLLVEGVTKIDKVHFDDKDIYNAENLRKILLATTKDIRVMFIKLADRLHNMRTLKHFRAEKRVRIAKETMDIFAPIAHKLGMWRIKGELEDLSLRYIEPEVYKFLIEKIKDKRDVREKKTRAIIRKIKKELEKENIEARVLGRAKYFTSIYKKMKKKSLDFSEIHDLIGIRIITRSISDCYAALGIVHNLWTPIPKRFKDYISIPKANGYQSLHTAVLGEKGAIEVQIRTEEMNNIAEYGVAAHWKYSGTEKDKRFDKKISWIKELIDWRSTSDDAKEFIDDFKIDMFESEIVVFTPKGDPISLPEGASPVDFAYEVHSDLGSRCSKAMVNKKLCSLNTILKSGDVVEILTAKNAKPSAQWLNFVKSRKAKSKIRSTLNVANDYDPKKARTAQKEKTENTNLVNYIGIEGKTSPVKLSKCCNPRFKDSIVGFYTKDKKITVHKKDCPNIYSIKNMKKAVVFWKEKADANHSELLISLIDGVGVLAEILSKIAQHHVNIKTINTNQSGEKKVKNVIKIESISHDRMNKLLDDLRKTKNVISVHEVDKQINL